MVKSVLNYLTRNEYAPQKSSDPDVGALGVTFEAHDPNPQYDHLKQPKEDFEYPILYPAHREKIQPFEPNLRALIDNMWKRGEVSDKTNRGPVTMGLRGQTPGAVSKSYPLHPRAVSPLLLGEAAFADDWGKMDTIWRTDAITFRGDTRPPVEVIGAKNGFQPQTMRTDEDYINGTVFKKFKSYMKIRYNRDITDVEYKSALSTTLPNKADKSLLLSYMMWRGVAEGEAFHLYRMTKDQTLKGYVSTSRSVVHATRFGTNANSSPLKNGWIYVTLVRGGFVVPTNGAWATMQEQEIAQWGPIPGERILGFRRLKFMGTEERRKGCDGPVYLRRGLRKTDRRAFNVLLDWLSHKTPTAEDANAA